MQLPFERVKKQKKTKKDKIKSKILDWLRPD